MNQKQLTACRAASALLFLASFIFFLLFHRGHLLYQEQFQLFLLTPSYFNSLASMPGGIAAWISRFFTQFFIFGVPGAVICAASVTGVQLLVAALAERKSFLSYSCSFIPAAMLWVSMCQRDSLLVPAVSVVISLALALACKSIKAENISAAAFVLLVAPVYWICGPAAVIFALLSLSTRKWWSVVLSLVIFAVMPLLVRPYVSLNLADLYLGRFLFKDPEIFAGLQLSAIAVTALCVGLLQFISDSKPVISWSVLALSFVGLGLGIAKVNDFRFDEEQVYSNLMRNEDWDGIIEMAEKKSPLDKMSISCLNLALAMKGRLGDDMFKYIQADASSLVPNYEKIHEDNCFISDILYHLGFVSPSQRHAFECKEAIPDMDKSSRVYQRLAQTNYINGQYAASQKYLDALSHTLFYRKWASEFPESCKEIPMLKQWRETQNDHFFVNENLYNELGQMYNEHRDNYVVFQYAVALALLNKDLDWFKRYTSMRSFNTVPRHYQEAFLLIWMQNHSTLDGVPHFISTRTLNRYKRFAEASQTISDIKYIFDKYGDTYWFYYYYNIVEGK